MRIRFLAAAFAAALIAAAPIFAAAGPISSYPAATTPLSGAETMVGTQAGSTVQITAASVAAIVTAATNSWTGVQTFPAPGASKGSIVLTPGTVSGTPPNGSLWTTSSGVFAEIGGSTVQFATGTNYATLGANTFTGKQSLAASGSGGAGINIGQGAAPASPVNGDLWLTTSGLFAQLGGSTVQFTAGGVTQTGSVIAGDCVKWNAANVIQDALVPCGGGSGSGIPGGPNGSIQFENGTSFSGTANFTYTTPGSVPTITGPDGTTWKTTGIKMGSSADLDINGGLLVSGSTPLIGVPGCSSGAGGATWLIGPALSSYCTNTTVLATDNICIGTITCGSGAGGGPTITSGCCNTTAGSEDMKVITSGSYNTGFGFESVHLVTTGGHNSALGDSALASVTTGSFNLGVGSSACIDVDVGSSNICIGGSGGTLQGGSSNVIVGAGGGTLTSGSQNMFLSPAGCSGCSGGYGVTTGSYNLWIGGQGPTLSNPSNSITIADPQGNILLQYLPANGYLSVKQSTRTTGNFTGVAATTVSGLASADASPIAGDRGFVTDATSCTFNSSVTGGGSTKCPVVYNGSAWVAG